MDGDMTRCRGNRHALMVSLIVGLIGTRARRSACRPQRSTEVPSYRPRRRNLKVRDSIGGVDAAEAATLILSRTTAYQNLHRADHVQQGRRVLVHRVAGAVGHA